MKIPFVEFFEVDGINPEIAMKEFFVSNTQFKLIRVEPVPGGLRAYYEVIK